MQENRELAKKIARETANKEKLIAKRNDLNAQIAESEAHLKKLEALKANEDKLLAQMEELYGKVTEA